jgi:chitodextrinase
MKTITKQFARLLLLAVCFGITTVSMNAHATTYRYLKLTANARTDMDVYFSEIEWMVGATAYPTVKLTDSSPTVTATLPGIANWCAEWKAFDGNTGTNWLPINDTGIGYPYSITLDLGAGNEIYPTAIKIGVGYKGRSLSSFTCEGSNNNTTWVNLLTVTGKTKDDWTSDVLNSFAIEAPVVDTENPSVPTGLASGTITATSVVLNWSASTDNMGIAGYQVYKDGNLIASPTGTTYTATGLTANTSYNFQVKAADGVGNTSALCTAISVTTTSAPSTPTYRYLKLTVNAHNNENYGPTFTELEWLDGATAYPSPKMSWSTTNSTATVSASIADAGGSQLWKAFDGGYDEGWAFYPVADGAFSAFPYSITIDLGAGNGIYPTSLKLGMASWGGRGIQSYSLDGSNNNSTWTNLKSVTATPTSSNLNTITIPAPVSTAFLPVNGESIARIYSLNGQIAADLSTLKGATTVSVIDTKGSVIKTVRSTGSALLTINVANKGVYLVRVQNGAKVSTAKVVL